MSSSSSNKYLGYQAAGGHRNGQKYKDSSSSGSRSQKLPTSSKSDGKATEKPRTAPAPVISFLFVVNEFQINYDYPIHDQWFNYMPPTSSTAYRGEYPGIVFRYHDGYISLAQDYMWYRPSMGKAGYISHIDRNSGTIDWCPEVYKTHSVFSCSALLPLICLQSDASLGSFMRSSCRCSAQHDDGYSWNLVHFTHYNGVSHVTCNCQGSPFVAGRNPSWMPSLVPKVFENTRGGGGEGGTMRSRGLGGDLPAVIALMAFHSSVGHASDVFTNGWWHRGQWRGPTHSPSGYPALEGNPRGFVVQVCRDPEMMPEVAADPNNTTAIDPLEKLEWETILVEG